MKKHNVQRILYVAAGLALASLASQARAQISIDGSLDSAYGSPLAIQTNDTGFGKSSDASGNSPGGSELDAAYGIIQNGNLNLFFAGNLEGGNSYNHLNIFIDDGRPGQSTLSTGGSSSLTPMNGSKFSPGFQATYALDINGGGSPITEYVNSFDLTQAAGSNGTTAYLGSFSGNNATANTVGDSQGNLSISFNNTNYNLGVAAAPGATNPGDGEVETGINASSGAATTVTTGLEVAIPLTLLGGTKGPIEVMADINGGGNNYLSNQFLPGLPTPSGNVGYNGGDSATNNPASPYSVSGQQGAFNLSNVSNAFFTVAGITSSSTNGSWNTGSGSWSLASNWNPAVVPTNAADTATFAFNTSSPTVSLNGSHTVGQITFNSSNGYTIAQGTSPSGGVLTIDDTGDVAGVNPLITVLAGSHTISAPMNFASGVTATIGASTNLAISGAIGGSGNITKTGSGNLTLAGSNTYSGNINILNGSVELDNPAAASGGIVFIGDSSADGVFTSLNTATSGLNISTEVVTNQDDSGQDNKRSIAGLYSSGNSTFSGPLYMDGGISFYTNAGTTLTYSGVIADGQDGNSVAKHDLTVNAASGGTIILTNAETYNGSTIVNSGTLTLTPTASLASPSVTVNGGTLNFVNQSSGGILVRTLTGSLYIATGGTVTVAAAASHANRQLLVANSLGMSASNGGWTAQLDLANNDMEIVNGNISNVTSQLEQGANFGGTPWTGLGITSSTAAANSTHLTAIGAIVNSTDGSTALYSSGTPLGAFDDTSPAATDVLLKYTYFGDANLDGKVDGSDYSLIDNGYLMNLTGWYNGDFNYDGVIDGSDYTLIDNSFNQQGASLAASVASPDAVATAQIAGTSAVPEPASLGILAISAVGLLGRRRLPQRS